MQTATEVVAALIWEQDKFMICQRPAHKARGLLWEFVGGQVGPGETRRSWQLSWMWEGYLRRWSTNTPI